MNALLLAALLAAGAPADTTAVPLGPPPSEIADLTLTNESEGVRVNWVIADTAFTDNYEIERSVDGGAWSTVYRLSPERALIGLVETFVDPVPGTGLNEYRVAVVKRDGQRVTWPAAWIVHVPRGTTGLYPNPTSIGQPVYLMLDVPLDAELQLELVDDNGFRVQYVALQATGEREQYQFTPAVVNGGSYAVRVYINDIPVESFNLQVR